MKPKAWLAAFIADPPDTDDCIEWPFSKNNMGYGKINWQGKLTLTHRLVLTGTQGEPPDPSYHCAHAPGICHTPACLNPRHLRWATRRENYADKRIDGTALGGTKNPRSKLTDDAVNEIYTSADRARDLAAKYGVVHQTIDDIRAGRSWTTVTGKAA